jgi:chlorite dismutase
MNSRLFSFIGGNFGQWTITEIKTIIGEGIGEAKRLSIVNEDFSDVSGETDWIFRGVTSNERYVIRSEKEQLLAKQAGLGRPEATCAALIPIRKTAAWWNLTQDERRQIFEETSHHTKIGLDYLPAIARRLHHCRDLSGNEPFDFLTWFEYAPMDSAAFEELVIELRRTPEWDFVEREIDIRLVRADN